MSTHTVYGNGRSFRQPVIAKLSWSLETIVSGLHTWRG